MPETHLGTAAINKVSSAISVLCSLLQLSPGAKCLPSGSITTCSSTVPSSSCLGVPHEGLPCDIGGGGGVAESVPIPPPLSFQYLRIGSYLVDFLPQFVIADGVQPTYLKYPSETRVDEGLHSLLHRAESFDEGLHFLLGCFCCPPGFSSIEQARLDLAFENPNLGLQHWSR